MTLAVVGFGPRGLACLENFLLELSLKEITAEVTIKIFEPASELGTGKAWELDQPFTNYINISDHALQNLQGREKIVWRELTLPSFPSYAKWCRDKDEATQSDGDKDLYPERSQMGTYLNQRAKSICEVLQKKQLLQVYKERVTHLLYANRSVVLTTLNTTHTVNECLLTLGHLPNTHSDETKKFIAHSKNTEAIYIHDPYDAVIARDDLSETTVAIKGFGLSMIDITRQLTNYKFGTFVESEEEPLLQFISEKGCVQKIVPYSLDGLPCMPKPYGRKVDQQFEPSIEQENNFTLALRNALAEPDCLENADFLLNAFSEIAAQIFSRNHTGAISKAEVPSLIIQWLKDPETSHALILDIKLPLKEYLLQSIHMAYGTVASSLDFTIGQVWRHLQPAMYRVFAFSGLPGAIIKEIVDIDERTKRYSYGPPVESMLQLVALVDAGILELRFAKDPEVEMIKEGWKFTKDDNEVAAKMLCNSVMEAPILRKLDSTLITSLQEQQLVQEVYKDLGIKTRPDGTLISKKENATRIPIAVVGRIAKGSVLGVDAVLECFSPETHDWARGVVNNLRRS
ncbi:FAD/NAD(P)-binding protein [Cochleicola gelatinilyticus]|uniref:FAD-dependent urate hydroxylase HpyO/Asp monooxygenase CreE-like FAD/NAD(P)-binding domain-containing protein n=1 Tax=Cochleicola gelatinilyticus TaxID=1763537 RepID=A0A167KFL1_9FLAO|nr:FAD/NAD(P)-binding protein [Cochleicola gelatinilyticus]OAB81840.1 hypothetical protein ULVI_00455 [Cochleicola gelatinilyticus]